jgi:hypothetical protein
LGVPPNRITGEKNPGVDCLQFTQRRDFLKKRNLNEVVMNLQKLKKYDNWIGKTPLFIVEAVKNVGGWSTVFPSGEFPRWAHRIRNYFNKEPRLLMRLEKSEAEKYLKNLEEVSKQTKKSREVKSVAKIKPSGIFGDALGKTLPEIIPIAEVYEKTKNNIIEDNALSGDVYRDEFGMIWYHMSVGSTIYHWGKDPVVPTVEGIYQETKLRGGPVQKLISPDGTGGSCETIIRSNVNEIGYYDSRVVTDEKKFTFVGSRIVTNSHHQGSYNYSETAVEGIVAHELRDVKPHTKYTGNNIYVNPSNRFSPLFDRIFSAYAKDESAPLAVQIK